VSSKPRRVMIFSVDYKPQAGGIAEHGLRVAMQFWKDGVPVVVVAPRIGRHGDFDRTVPFETRRVPRVPLLDLVFYFGMCLYLITRRKIDVVYCVTSHPCAAICRLLRLFVHFRFTVTVHAHEVVYSGSGFRPWLKRRLKRLQIGAISSADRIFAVSGFTQTCLAEAGADRSKISVIYNGVDLAEFDGIGGVGEVVTRLGLGGRRIILTIARLDIHKGQDVVIRAMPAILEKVPKAVYVIAGDGPMYDTLREIRRRVGVTDSVVLTGGMARADVLALLKACDVFVMASRIERGSTEGFGIVFLEAGALGKPVVGGRSGGIPDAVEDGVVGLLVDPHDPEAVADAVTRILLDADLASRLGKHGLERVRSDFTWDKVMDRIVDGLSAAER
jgi:phosphatidylinositol alpha-1,6-mannosyltransferase